jgi:hypothetical protein
MLLNLFIPKLPNFVLNAKEKNKTINLPKYLQCLWKNVIFFFVNYRPSMTWLPLCDLAINFLNIKSS